jgi:deoxyribose-phosphate aldolase
VKATGGIHDRRVAEAMLAAGATRLGVVPGHTILQG